MYLTCAPGECRGTDSKVSCCCLKPYLLKLCKFYLCHWKSCITFFLWLRFDVPASNLFVLNLSSNQLDILLLSYEIWIPLSIQWGFYLKPLFLLKLMENCTFIRSNHGIYKQTTHFSRNHEWTEKAKRQNPFSFGAIIRAKNKQNKTFWCN